MKKFLLVLFAFISINTFAQINVKEGSFHKIDGYLMLDKEDHRDDNWKPMALIKISTEGMKAEERARLIFHGNMETYIDVKQMEAETYLYLSAQAATFIEIKHPDYGKTEYWFPEDLCDYCGYEMVVQYVPIVPNQEAKPQNTYLIIKSDQDDAVVYIDDEYAGSKEAYKSLGVGSTHTWRIECDLYHTESGTVTLRERTEINKILRPAYGFLNVTTEPENGAVVFINNKKVGETPYKSDKLASGSYSVKVMKEMYKTVENTYIVSDGYTTDAFMNMNSNYVDVTITTDAESDIYVDEEYKGRGTWQGRLSDGAHYVEARKELHEISSKNINLVLGEPETIILEAPKPFSGFLDINTSPMSVDIYIDGSHYGQTPNIISDLTVGKHELRLSKSGYADIKKTIMIAKNETLSLQEKMMLNVSSNNEAKEKINLEKKTIVGLNVAYSVSPQLSYGLTFGQVKKVGWYVNVMSNFNFNALNCEYECQQDGTVDGEMMFYNGERAKTRISVGGGALYRIAQPLCLKAGLGYGMRNLAWQDVEKSWVKNSCYSYSGVEFDAGVMLLLGKVNASADALIKDRKSVV